jgi:hypothetical protein
MPPTQMQTTTILVTHAVFRSTRSPERRRLTRGEVVLRSTCSIIVVSHCSPDRRGLPHGWTPQTFIYGSSDTRRQAHHARQDRHTIRCRAPWPTCTGRHTTQQPHLASPPVRTSLTSACRTRAAPHVCVVHSRLRRPGRLTTTDLFSTKLLIPNVGNGREHMFPVLPPRLACSNAHTRRQPEVEDDVQWSTQEISGDERRSRRILASHSHGI